MKRFGDEDLPLFMDEKRPSGIVAPPMFAVKYAGISIVNAFFDPDFHVDFARLVHGEQDMEWRGPVRPGDTVTTVLKIGSVEEKSSGELFTTESESKNQHGESVVRMVSTFFIRGEKSGGSKKKPPKEEPTEPHYLFTQDMCVTEDQTYLYAEGSGDNNPIHVNPEFALKVGLPGIILQGLCTMAFCFKAIQDRACEKDPLRIRRLKVRFAKPVLPLDTVTTRAWEVERGQGPIDLLGFDAVNQSGDIVIRNGVAEIKAGG
ncbi:MAG: MaoC/PaaZ C-terminal domain-containing protein [Thermodesulfobacteriota bacterium]